MDQQTPMLAIGVGNWYRSDDAVGLVVARKLRAMNLPGVQVKEENGEGVSLMEAWRGNERVIIVDAASSGSRPGTVHTLNADSTTIPSAFFHYSSHAFSVAESIELARALKQLPPQLIVYGIEGKNFAAGVGLSPEIEHASDVVIRQIVDQILIPIPE
jgi:hydrogenase maturation protease